MKRLLLFLLLFAVPTADFLRAEEKPALPRAASPSGKNSGPLPSFLLDFRDGKMEATIAPGEKRMGRVQFKGVLKNPYTTREGKRRSILDHLRKTEGGHHIVLGEPLGIDIFGALNSQSGTLAATYLLGERVHQGGELFSVRSTFSGSTQRGPMAWRLAISPSPEAAGNVVFTLETGGLTARSEPVAIDDKARVNIAIRWDVAQGAALAIDGRLVGMASVELPKTERSLPMERMEIHANHAGELHSFSLYNVALSSEAIARLSRGESVTEADAPPQESALPAPDWERGASPLELRPGKPLRIKEAIVTDAREEGMRAGGWLAVDGQMESSFPWWYHGYRQLPERMLEITLAPGSRPGRWSLKGNVKGSLTPVAADGTEQPPLLVDDQEIAQRQGPVPPADRYRLRVKEGHAFEIGFQNVEVDAAPASGEKLYLAPAASIPETIAPELVTRYHARSRQFFTAVKTAPPPAGERFSARQAWHIVTPVQTEALALGEVGLRLQPATPLREPVRVKITLHSPDSPFHHLSQQEVTLLPGEGAYEFWIDLRDTMLLKGDCLWLTLQGEHPLPLQLGQGGSLITLVPAADREEALALWRESLWRTTRNHLESISEPRPWGGIDDNPANAWWLRQIVPAYAALERGLERLRSRFPDDRRFLSAYVFTHPNAPNPAKDLSLPEAEPGAPRWAFLMRENLRLYKAFVHWWIDHRQHANGEFGNWYGDDTDLLQEWTNLAFISDPGNKVRDSFTRLSESIATGFSLNAAPIIQNGLNTRYTDSLHAYEEGLNLQPADFLLHYGHPKKFARLLKTISRYDGFLLTETGTPGELRFTGQEGASLLFFNTVRPPKGGHLDHRGYLFLHPALVAGWYQRDPAIWNYLEAVGRWSLKRTDEKWKPMGSQLLMGLYLHSGKLEWLAPFLHQPSWEKGKISFADQAFLPGQVRLKISREAAQAALADQQAARDVGYFDRLGSELMGESDRRFMEKWLEWKLTGDEEALCAGLETQWRKWKFILPTVTEAEMSGDRVGIPKHLLAQLYLGGSAGARNLDFYPDFAVTYEGWNEFAAIVEEDTPERLRLRFYLFGTQPGRGIIRPWKLAEGVYRLEQEEENGAIFTIPALALQRGDGVEVEVPPGKTVNLTFIQESRTGMDQTLRGDAALQPGGEGIRREGDSLLVPVYNLGSVALADVDLLLFNSEGRTLAQTTIPSLPPVQRWKLGETLVRLPLPAGDSQGTLRLELRSPAPEITRRNNVTNYQYQ
ncbi:MAG TPA: hypothetical protein VNQ90_00945 [Chthoniobacteraceae bacterium]|nr:hypothetical protein [Chthoniobacteraceae bacterium]